MNYNFDANTTTGQQFATLTLNYTGAGQDPTLQFSQAAAGSLLGLNPTSNEVTSAAGSYTMQVTSNASWSASSSPFWLTLAVGSTSGGAGTTTVTYNVASDNGSARNGTITFTAGSNPPATFNVLQDAAPPSHTLTITPNVGDVFSSGSQQFSVALDGNNISASSVTWSVTTGGVGIFSPSFPGMYLAPSYVTPPSDATITATYPGVPVASATVHFNLSIPVVTSVSPSSGSGSKGSFALTAQSPTGNPSDIASVFLGFSTRFFGGYQPQPGDCAVSSGGSQLQFWAYDSGVESVPWNGVQAPTLIGSTNACDVQIKSQDLVPAANYSTSGSSRLRK